MSEIATIRFDGELSVLYHGTNVPRTITNREGNTARVVTTPVCVFTRKPRALGLLLGTMKGEDTYGGKFNLAFLDPDNPDLVAFYWAMWVVDQLSAVTYERMLAAYYWAVGSPEMEAEQEDLQRTLGKRLDRITEEVSPNILEVAVDLMSAGMDLYPRTLQRLIDQGKVGWIPEASGVGLCDPTYRFHILMKLEAFLDKHAWLLETYYRINPYLEREWFDKAVRQEVREGLVRGFDGSVLMAVAIYRCLTYWRQVARQTEVEPDKEEAWKKKLGGLDGTYAEAIPYLTTLLLMGKESLSYAFPPDQAVVTGGGGGGVRCVVPGPKRHTAWLEYRRRTDDDGRIPWRVSRRPILYNKRPKDEGDARRVFKYMHKLWSMREKVSV